VTGGSGFVGQRLVEMLTERGAELVISFDISPKPKDDALTTSKVKYVQGDLTKYEDLSACGDIEQLDCIFHIAVLVGPSHTQEAYYKVNYEGTRNILQLASHKNIKKIVMSSSPSPRFPYPDPNVNYLTENELFKINGGDYTKVFLQEHLVITTWTRTNGNLTIW
jgi:nucleoside-diphosphate-sugar epimerase